MRALVALSLIAVAAGGCKRANDKFCNAATPCESGTCNLATNECEAEPPDAGIDAAVCGSDLECTVETSPICDDGSGVCRGCDTGAECLAKDPATPECDGDGACVECLASTACDAVTPICTDGACAECTAHTQCEDRDDALPRCADDGTCVECTEHADCASGVCNRMTNACVDAAALIYVHPSGSASSGCGDVGNECRTITLGLEEVTKTRFTLSVAAGTYSETALADNVTATIVGPTTAIVNVPFQDQAAMLLVNGSDITLDGLTIRGAFGNSSADGINCSSSSSITAFRTIITGNEASGVDAGSGCSVTLDEVQITNNDRLGIFVNGGDLHLHRSLVQNNDSGGIEVVDAPFDIVNNIIVLNGSSAGGGSLFGGVRIALGGTEATMVFAHNTVAENQSDSGGSARGVFCFADTTARNNIVWGGSGAAATGGNCSWTYSDIQGGKAGTGNLDVDPEFVDVSSDNYHLDPASPVKDQADPASAVDVDFDGDDRPRGGRNDIGADEL